MASMVAVSHFGSFGSRGSLGSLGPRGSLGFLGSLGSLGVPGETGVLGEPAVQQWIANKGEAKALRAAAIAGQHQNDLLEFIEQVRNAREFGFTMSDPDDFSDKVHMLTQLGIKFILVDVYNDGNTVDIGCYTRYEEISELFQIQKCKQVTEPTIATLFISDVEFVKDDGETHYYAQHVIDEEVLNVLMK